MEWSPVLLMVTLDQRNTVSSNLRSSNLDNKDIGVTKRKQKNSNCKGCLKFKLLLISEMKIQCVPYCTPADVNGHAVAGGHGDVSDGPAYDPKKTFFPLLF